MSRSCSSFRFWCLWLSTRDMNKPGLNTGIVCISAIGYRLAGSYKTLKRLYDVEATIVHTVKM